MASFGELFPGVKKLRKESDEDAGAGELFESGPLDLDAGVARFSPRPRRDKAVKDVKADGDDDQTA